MDDLVLMWKRSVQANPCFSWSQQQFSPTITKQAFLKTTPSSKLTTNKQTNKSQPRVLLQLFLICSCQTSCWFTLAVVNKVLTWTKWNWKPLCHFSDISQTQVSARYLQQQLHLHTYACTPLVGECLYHTSVVLDMQVLWCTEKQKRDKYNRKTQVGHGEILHHRGKLTSIN